MKTVALQWYVVAAVSMLMLITAAIFAASHNRPAAVPAGGEHVAGPLAAKPKPIAVKPQEVVVKKPVDNFQKFDVMLRGYCYANSQLPDTQAPGGFGPSQNSAQKTPRKIDGEGLFLLAQPTEQTTFGEKPGMQVLLVNRTDETLKFAACDSRLSIIQEAQDAGGTWLPIEYLPSSWCGNSYHHVFLKPDNQWAFPAPRYQGHLPTRLRFTMTLEDGAQIHSNEFEGSVNLGQFTHKAGHQPTNIMDPYDE